MNPIIIIDEPTQPHKERTVEIYFEELYKHINSLTYKFTEGRMDMDEQTRNAASTDTSESLDGHLVARGIEFRDAKVRMLLMKYLVGPEPPTTTEDDHMELQSKLTYNLSVPTDWDDVMLAPLKDHIHRYLVWGTLFDWYGAGLGSDQQSYYNSQLLSLENQISSLLKGRSTRKRPLQPFGPAKKLY